MENLDEECVCRICGFVDGPFREDGCALNSICGCCGSESGIEDNLLEGVRSVRGYWVCRSSEWFRPSDKPEGWDLLTQLENIPPEWR
ncbi:hypothetical protein [Streptomyces chrestomyceticus]|uniref:hypothetical protein n=1 Tax=Streptomyces chrestomyceticus TaxID=68185 RepID=UPI0033FEE07D